METMKSAVIIVLNFFKKINRFKEEPEAKKAGCEQKNC